MSQKAIDDLKASYLSWTDQALTQLRALITDLPPQPPATHQNLSTIFEIGHNIKGMGGSFGFPLMTEVGQALCLYLRHVEHGGGPADRALLDRLLRLMEEIVTESIEGDGDEWGQQTRKTLDATLTAAGVTDR